MSSRSEHTFGETVRLVPPEYSCCDECGRLEHLRPHMDMLVCDGCRVSMVLEDCWDWPDDAA